MPNRISNAQVDEISFVNRPAEPNAVVAFFKRDDSDDEEIGKGQPTSGAVMASGGKRGFMDALAARLGMGAKEEEDEMEEEEVSEEDMEKSIDDLIKSEAERLLKLEADEGGKTHSSERSANDPNDGGGMNESVMDSASDEVKEFVAKLEAERDEAIAKNAEFTKAADGKEDESDDLMKNADPALVEMIRKADQRAEAAEKIAKAERNQRIEKEFVAKAEDLPHLGEEPETLGAMMRTISEAVDDETYEKLDFLLKAAEAKLNESSLFKELGGSGTGTTGDAYAQLEAIAKSIQERDTLDSYEAAFDKAMDERPELYERYLEEQVV